MAKFTKSIAAVLTAAAGVMICISICINRYKDQHDDIGLPEPPDTTQYQSIKERAIAAKEVIRRHHLNEDYCLLVDYSIPSGTPRMYVWSYQKDQVVARTYVMHGPGKGSTASRPVFSNEPGSNCTALGRFVVTHKHGAKLKRSFRLKGLDTDNQTAFARGLMIHKSSWIDRHCHKKYIPLHEPSCLGCVTVSSRGMDYLERLILAKHTKIMLWSYCSQKESNM